MGALAEVFLEDFGTWQKLPEAAKTGLPTAPQTADAADNPFWHVLVTAIAPLSLPVAHMVAERLGLATAGPMSWLDVGGGSGVWSAACGWCEQAGHRLSVGLAECKCDWA